MEEKVENQQKTTKIGKPLKIWEDNIFRKENKSLKIKKKNRAGKNTFLNFNTWRNCHCQYYGHAFSSPPTWEKNSKTLLFWEAVQRNDSEWYTPETETDF